MQHRTGADAKIGVVNGFRGIAILMVVLHHLFIPYAAKDPLHAGQLDPDGIFAAFIANAWLGVPLFFVLSGFVLYLPYRLGRRKVETLADIRSFYLHRAQRLLPLYFIVVLVSLTLHAQTGVGSLRWYLEAGGLLSTLFVFSPHGFMPPSNMVLWSVSVEIWFSVLFPVLIIAIRRWGIAAVVVAILAASSIFNFIGGSIPVANIGSFRPFTNGIFGSCYQFVLGMLVCDLYVRQLENPKRPAASLASLLAGLVLGSLGLYITHHAPWLAVRVLGSMMFSIAFSLVLFGSLFAGSLLRSFLETWPLQLLGCMCYSIYAWHGIVMNDMIPPDASMLADTMRMLAPFTVLMLALSALSYRYIEFGHRRDWKALFLFDKAEVQPQAASVAPALDQQMAHLAGRE